MTVHATAAIAVAELRTAIRLVRTWTFALLGISVGLVCYLVQSLAHIALWTSSHLVTAPRFFVGTIGGIVLSIAIVTAVLLAFDVRARERRERIDEVLNARPHSNLARLTGQLVGIVLVVWLSAVAFVVVIQAFGLLIGEALEPVSLSMFLLFDALPGIVFWTSLTLLLSTMLRFRLAAVVVALGLFGLHLAATWEIPLFLHGSVATNLAATHLPSDVAPVLPTAWDLVLRASLVVLAAGFITLAAVFHPRRDAPEPLVRTVAGTGLVAAGVVLIAALVVRSFAEMDLREAWLAAQEAHRDEPAPDLEVISGTILIEPGKRLAIDVQLALANPHDHRLEHLVFSLNPGIKVEQARIGGKAVSYRHEMGILVVEPHEPLAERATLDLAIRAKGVPDPRFAYLDSAIDNLARPIDEAPINTLGTVASIFRSDYVALMPGVRWLPAPGPNLSSGDASERPRDFYTLDLEVEVPAGWLVAGPGRREAVADERFRFRPRAVVDDVGLFASRFERRAMLANEIEFELLFHPAHGRNVRLFGDATDALRARVETFLNRAGAMGLGYPYAALSLVEVPGRLRTYGGGWRMDSVEVLPGVVLLREVGFPVAKIEAALRRGDFRVPGGDPKVGVLERFFRGNVGGGDLRLDLARELFFAQTGARGEGALALEFVCQDLIARLMTGAGGYFTPHLVSSGGFTDAVRLILINVQGGGSTGVGYTLRKDARDRASTWQWARRTSLADLDPQSDPEKAMHTLALKGQAIGQALIQEMGQGTGEFLSALRERFAGRTFTLADFEATAASLGTPVGPLLGDWIHETSLPGFVASPLTIERLADNAEGEPGYQTRVHVHNGEPVGGLLRLRYMVHSGTSSTGIRNHWSRPLRVGPHESLEIGMVVPGSPQAGWVEPYLSLNQGSLALPQPQFDEAAQSSAEPFNGTRSSDWRPFPEGEVVVDDLDPGFVVARPSVSATTGWAAVLSGEVGDVLERDEGLPVYTRFGGIPTDWTRLTVGNAWGRYRHTIATTSTRGTASEAVFATELPTAGRWRADYHLPFRGSGRVAADRFDPVPSRNRERAVRAGSPMLLTMPMGTYPMKLITGNVAVSVDFDASRGVEGWNPIGEIDLGAPGEVRVVVSLDEVNALTPVVIADAVRWTIVPDA